MKIELVPDIKSEFPQWVKLANVLVEQDVVDTLTFKALPHGQMNFDDAEDAIVGLFAWRDLRDYPSVSSQGQANMYDLVEMARRLGIVASEATIASMGAHMEHLDYIMHDSPPNDEPGYFAYLNRGGLERGLSVLGRMYEERVYIGRSAPTAFGTVDFSHNSQQVSDAIASVEAASAVISSSNTLSPEEKQTWLSHLEAGVSLLKKPKVYLSAITVLLLQPLYSAYSSIIEDSAKPIIETALSALKNLVGF